MDSVEAVALAECFVREAKKKYPVSETWLYGSFAYGHPTEESDIDIAVIMDPAPENIIETEIDLYRIRRAIDTRLEPIILEPENDRSGFSEMVTTKGIRIYPASDV